MKKASSFPILASTVALWSALQGVVATAAVYDETFDTMPTGWTDRGTEPGSWSIQSGALVHVGPGSAGTTRGDFLISPIHWDLGQSMTISVDVLWGGGLYFEEGVAWAYTKDPSGYRSDTYAFAQLSTWDSTIRLQEFGRGGGDVLSSSTRLFPNIQANKWYRFNVAVDDSGIATFEVDGTRVALPMTLQEGFVALGSNGSRGLTIKFDNLHVEIGGDGDGNGGGVVGGGGVEHPADTNKDFVISQNEVTGYAAAWINGQSWPAAPNPIPQDYVTRAGYLWLNGETYRVIAGATPPLNWEKTQ